MISKIQEIFSGYIKAKFRRDLINTIIITLCLSIILWFITIIAELLFEFKPFPRTVLVSVFFIGILAVLVWETIVSIKNYKEYKNPDYIKTAFTIGSHYKDIKDTLGNAVQLCLADKSSENSLVKVFFSDIAKKTTQYNFATLIKFDKVKKNLYILLSIIVIFASLMVLSKQFSFATYRVLHFNQKFVIPKVYVFDVKPGDAKVLRGQNVNISVNILRLSNGKNVNNLLKNLQIAIKYFDQPEFQFQKLTMNNNGYYSLNINSVSGSFTYFFVADRIKSAEYQIDVVTPPVINKIDLSIQPPIYSGLPKAQIIDNGNITALKGTLVNLEINSSEKLKKAYILLSDGKKMSMNIDNSKAKIEMRLFREFNYKIFIEDINGTSNIDPITYSVKLDYDMPPSLDVIYPSTASVSSSENRLQTVLKISDDYGFSALKLYYRISESKFEKPQVNFNGLNIPITKDKNQDVNYIWNFSQLSLVPGDAVQFYFEIFDNDAVSGPKSAKSGFYTLKIPSLDEIYENIDNKQENIENKMEKTLKEAEDLRQELKKVSQELKQDRKDLTWQEKEKIDKAVKKFEKVQNDMKNLEKDFSQLKKDMMQNNLYSQETMQKYMELQDLMKEFGTDEFKKAMEKMQQQLQNMNRSQTQADMQNMEFNEENFKKSVERTLNLLKRIQIEQKTDEIQRRMDDLMKRQDEVQNKMQNNNISNDEKKNLAQQQKNITNDVKELQKEMQSLQNKMKDFEDMPNNKMQEMNKEMNEQNNDELSEQATQQMISGQTQQAQKNQSKLKQNMSQMKQKMSAMQKQMQQKNQMQTFKEMFKIIENTIELSKEQEKLMNETAQNTSNFKLHEQLANRQEDLRRDINKLLNSMGKVAQKSFAITPEMAKKFGQAQSSMQNGLNYIKGGNPSISVNSQRDAMKNLNEAAQMMKQALQSMSQQKGGGSGGMMSLMQQFQQMIQQQMQLNSMTQQLSKGGQLTPQEQGQLQRLAQQQEILKKSLEQLNKEAQNSGQSKKIPGNLDNIAKEMQEIVNEMKSGHVNDELVQKQEKILSRMLDAHKSINDRDYEKERESQKGKTFLRQSPESLKIDGDRRKEFIKDQINRTQKEGYSRDYQELIRKYYQNLYKIK